MRTLQELLPDIERGGKREAVRWTNGFRTFVSTYGDLYGTIGAVLSRFESLGLRKGDRILIRAENRMEWVAVFWACVASGIIAVPVDVGFSEELVRRIRVESGAKLVIDRSALEAIGALPRSRRIRTVDVGPEDVVEIVYTSGTTGEPKGITHRHRHLCANLQPFRTEIGKYKRWAWPFQPVRILDLLPLSHMFGQALGIYIPVFLGGAAVFTPEIHPARIVDIVRRNRVTVIVSVPQILNNLRNEVERRRLLRYRRIHSAFGWKFWAFVVGGADVDPELEKFWGNRGFLVIQGYGLTEASPVVAVNHPFDVKRGSLGKVLPGVDVTIAPDGEILIRGESVTSAGDSGWLHTGDLGEIDTEGRLYYRGRKKDTIVTAEGLNVHPEDVERVLALFREIRDSAVVGVRKNGNEQVHAALILNDPNADVEMVIRRANERLEAHQKIGSWSVWPGNDFPRTASTMKVKRAEVRNQLTGGKKLQERAQTRDLSAMSSLERVELLSELESRYRVELNEAEFSQLQNTQELQDWLRRTSPVAGPGRPASEWPRALPIRMLRAAFQRLIAVPLFRHYLPLTVTGLEHLDDLEPPAIFAANHVSHLDAPALLAALPSQWRRLVAPAMGLDLFQQGGWWAGLGYVLALALFNAYPLPHDLAGVRRALNYTGDLIRRGYCPLVFPEGERSPNGSLHEFRPGIGMMATRLRVPVVPVRIEGLYAVYSVNDSWPKRGSVRVSFGPPLRFFEESYDAAARKVRQAIEELRSR
jgi:long-chain acyl-CoA synthetase